MDKWLPINPSWPLSGPGAAEPCRHKDKIAALSCLHQVLRAQKCRVSCKRRLFAQCVEMNIGLKHSKLRKKTCPQISLRHSEAGQTSNSKQQGDEGPAACAWRQAATTIGTQSMLKQSIETPRFARFIRPPCHRNQILHQRTMLCRPAFGS